MSSKPARTLMSFAEIVAALEANPNDRFEDKVAEALAGSKEAQAEVQSSRIVLDPNQDVVGQRYLEFTVNVWSKNLTKEEEREVVEAEKEWRKGHIHGDTHDLVLPLPTKFGVMFPLKLRTFQRESLDPKQVFHTFLEKSAYDRVVEFGSNFFNAAAYLGEVREKERRNRALLEQKERDTWAREVYRPLQVLVYQEQERKSSDTYFVKTMYGRSLQMCIIGTVADAKLIVAHKLNTDPERVLLICAGKLLGNPNALMRDLLGREQNIHCVEYWPFHTWIPDNAWNPLVMLHNKLLGEVPAFRVAMPGLQLENIKLLLRLSAELYTCSPDGSKIERGGDHEKLLVPEWMDTVDDIDGWHWVLRSAMPSPAAVWTPATHSKFPRYMRYAITALTHVMYEGGEKYLPQEIVESIAEYL